MNMKMISMRPAAGPRMSMSRRQMNVNCSIKIGDIAPEFTLPNQNGKNVSVKFNQLFGGKPSVLFFYPKDNTPGCTREAKAFRDNFSRLQKLGANVIGISSDSVDSHKSFAEDLELPYQLLSDEGDEVRNMYGVPKDLFGLLAGRQTFVISKTGEVKLVFNSQLKPEDHVEEAIKALSN